MPGERRQVADSERDSTGHQQRPLNSMGLGEGSGRRCEVRAREALIELADRREA